MSKELPPLPRATIGEFYTKAQMYLYGQARERAAYERAANRAMEFAEVQKGVEAHNACVFLADLFRSWGAER